jgi:hypothetical protein
MADVPDPMPIPASLRAPLRALLRGETAEWPVDVNAGDAIESIEQNGLAPLVYARLSDWPIRAALRGIAIRAAAAETARFDDLRALLAAFDASGIRMLIIKGTALAYDIYPSPELRPRGDTDLLIRESDLDAVRAIFRERGYASPVTSGDTLAVRQQSFTRGGHVYDVHWDVANSPVVRDALPFEELLGRAIPIPRIAPNALAPSHVDALLLACIHRVVHHHDVERLIWLYDIHLLREAMSAEEHGRFWRMAADRGVVAICERSSELADEWFAAAPHDRASDWLPEAERNREEPSAAFLDRSRTRGAALAGDLKALSWRGRLRRIRELALPPIGFMRQSFPSAPAVALPALYLWRGARGVLRLLRRDRPLSS